MVQNGTSIDVLHISRGVRVEFANPMYNIPAETRERSRLPISHPDFSPDPPCPPKELFKEEKEALRKRQPSPSPTRKRTVKSEAGRKSAMPSGPSANGWDDSDEEAELHIAVPKRLFH